MWVLRAEVVEASNLLGNANPHCSICVVTDPGLRNSQLVHHDGSILRAMQEQAAGRIPTELRTRGCMGSSYPVWNESFAFTEAAMSNELLSTTNLVGGPLVVLLLIRDDYSAHAAVAAVHIPAPRGATGVSDDWYTLRDSVMNTQILGVSGHPASVRFRYEYGILGDTPQHLLPPALGAPQSQGSSIPYSSQIPSEVLANAHLYSSTQSSNPVRRGPKMISPPSLPRKPPEVLRPSDSLLMYNREASALYHENSRLAESIAAWENLMSPVAAIYETEDNHVIEGHNFEDTIFLPARTSKKPVHVRCCTSKFAQGVIEIAGLTDTLFVEICSNVRIMVSAVLKQIVVVGCSNVELAIGGNPPSVVLLASKNCTMVACKDTWTSPWQSIGCTDISVHAAHYAGLDSLEPVSLLQADMVEKVLLPDMLVASVHRGTMTTQCHFSQLPALQEYRPPEPLAHSRPPPVSNGASAAFLQPHAPPPPQSQPQPAKAAPLPPPPPPEPEQPPRHQTLPDFLTEQHKRLCGAGLLLRRTEEGLTEVAEMARGGPAEQDGRIHVGDFIMAVDGVSTAGKRLRDVGMELSGPEGSELTVTLKRFTAFGTSHMDVVLTRRPVATSFEDNNLYDPMYASFNPPQPRPRQQPTSAPPLPADIAVLPLYGAARGVVDMDASLPHVGHTPRRATLSVERAAPPPASALNNRFSTVSVPKAPKQDFIFDEAFYRPRSAAPDGHSQLVGVGMGVKPMPDGSYCVSAVVTGSVADQSGQVAVGDVLHSVDGIPICGKTDAEVSELVRGYAGSRVVLVFLRPEASPENLRQSVGEFDWWRSVVLTRTAADTAEDPPSLRSSVSPPSVGMSRSELSIEQSKAAILASLGKPRDPASRASLTNLRSTQDSIPPSREPKRETVALALWIDEDFSRLPTDEASLTIHRLRMEGDIATALKTELSRIRVVDLLPGSVIADVHVLPQQLQFSGDARSSQRLAAEVSLMAVDPNSPLRIAATTRKATHAEVRGPVSEVRPLREVMSPQRFSPQKQANPPQRPPEPAPEPIREWPTANPAMPPVPPPRGSLYSSAPHAPFQVAASLLSTQPKQPLSSESYSLPHTTPAAARSSPPMEMPPPYHTVVPTGKKAGVGVELQKSSDGATMVLAVLSGGTAWASGQLHPGDTIVAVDYAETAGMEMHEVVSMIVGEPGTSVVLSVAKAHGKFDSGSPNAVVHLPLLRRVEDVSDPRQQLLDSEKLAKDKVDASQPAKLLKKAEAVSKKLEEIEDKEHLKEQQEMIAYIRRSRGSLPSSPQLNAQSAPAQPQPQPQLPPPPPAPQLPPPQSVPETVTAAPPPPAEHRSAPPSQPPTASRPSPDKKLASIYTSPPRTVVLERAFAPSIAPQNRVGTCGVGLSFQAIRLTGQMMVTSLVPGGSAELSGQVVAGDVIHLVNNNSVTSKRIPDVVAMIKGPPGTPVVLELQTTCFTNKDMSGTVGGTLYSSNAGKPGPADRGLRSSFSDAVPHLQQQQRTADPGPYPNYSLYGSSPGHATAAVPPSRSPPITLAQAMPTEPVEPPKAVAGSSPRQDPATSSIPAHEVEVPTWGQLHKSEGNGRQPEARREADGIRVVRLVRSAVAGQPGKVDLDAVGVGVGFQLSSDGTYVVSGLVPGSAAESCGELSLTDRILAVNGAALAGLSVEQVVKLIRGPQGSIVTMTVEDSRRDRAASVGSHTLPSSNQTKTPEKQPLAGLGLTVTGEPPHTVVHKNVLMDPHRVFEGQPAYDNQPLEVGDEIVTVNQMATKAMPPGALQAMLLQPAGTVVDLLCRSKHARTADDTFFVRLMCHEHAETNGEARQTPPDRRAQRDVPATRTLRVTVIDAVGLHRAVGSSPLTYVCKLDLRHPKGALPGSTPSSVSALTSGGSPSFGNHVATFHVPAAEVQCVQLETTIWDFNAGLNGFFGEVLLNVEQIGVQGRYFEHTFDLQPSKKYSGQHPPVGRMTLGLSLDRA